MRKVTIEIADDEVLVALKRPEGYENARPQLVSDAAIKDDWPDYRTIKVDGDAK